MHGSMHSLLAKGRTLVLRGYAGAYARVYVEVHCVLELFTKRVSGMCRPGIKRNA